MPMTQDDIRRHYEPYWQEKADRAGSAVDLGFSNPVEDAVLYPIYQSLIADLKIHVNGGKLLDVGSGSGRWIRFFLERFQPAAMVGVDYAQSSVDLLGKWHASTPQTRVEFRKADITDPNFGLDDEFDLINVANVLFHIPEADLYVRALHNLAKLVANDGRIVTTEYLPRTTMRTEWMLVRSRYEFEHLVKSVGLRIVAIRAFSFSANDPFGIDGPNDGARLHFSNARTIGDRLLAANPSPDSQAAIIGLLVELERAAIDFCRERMAEIELPSQKLVVLARAAS